MLIITIIFFVISCFLTYLSYNVIKQFGWTYLHIRTKKTFVSLYVANTILALFLLYLIFKMNETN